MDTVDLHVQILRAVKRMNNFSLMVGYRRKKKMGKLAMSSNLNMVGILYPQGLHLWGEATLG